MNEVWSAVERYFDALLIAPDPVLESALAASAAAGLPTIQVSASQGKLLMLIAQAMNARRILEIGTLAGYSTIWLARALPEDGRLVTLELDPRHAEVARGNIARAGFADRVEVRVGHALDALRQLAAADEPPFDLVFMDADKASLPDYFAHSLALARVGGLIIADNVVREGAVVDEASMDASVRGVRCMNDAIAAERRVSATAIQTVGSKGHDGFVIARVVA